MIGGCGANEFSGFGGTLKSPLKKFIHGFLHIFYDYSIKTIRSVAPKVHKIPQISQTSFEPKINQ